MATNNVGNQNIYKYEDFILNGQISQNPVVDMELALTIGCSGRLVPRGYKNIDKNYDESLPLGKYPTCAWSSDAFINWLTGNAVDVTTSIVGTVASIFTGNIVGIAGGVASLIGQFNKASLLPSIQGGNNTGDVSFSTLSTNIVLHHMRAKTEYLKCIDDYFTRFGYKINRVKVPNITGRTYWNYVEIGDSEDIGYGDVPSNFMEIINNACRKGVTIWHDHSNIGNYSLNNTIVE